MANDQQKQCKECGCKCNKCLTNDHDVHLHVEIENLKQKLVERDSHIATMETTVLNDADKFPNGEYVALQEELLTWQDKYRRLYEAHRRIQRVNQGLEDKLLRLVDSCETEKGALTRDVATLSHKLAEANYSIKKLTDDNERYRNDVALAIQFLQCKQTNFVSQRLDTLPNEVQAKVFSYMVGKRKPEEKKSPQEIKSIKVPIPTFPPTAMVYSIPKTTLCEEDEEKTETAVDIVSAAIMAKVLEERERERALAKHCDTCTCSKSLKIINNHVLTHCVGTQTGNYETSLCLRCNVTTDLVIGTMKIIKDSGLHQSKIVPIYTHDYDNNFLQVQNNKVINNIAKVEPNNYLKVSRKSTECEFDNDEEETPLLDPKHHYLCDDNPSVGFHNVEKCDVSAKKTLKGPRYCSVRVQSGSKNILLDNVHNSVAPVLYTHPTDKKLKKDDHNLKIATIKTQSSHKPSISSQTQSYSSEDFNNSGKTTMLDESQNQQRVAEWIHNNQKAMGNDNGSDESLKTNNCTNSIIDQARYAEMENNVKKFLFGENQSEFLKKVALGKQNYQNLRGFSAENNVVSCNKTLKETDI